MRSGAELLSALACSSCFSAERTTFSLPNADVPFVGTKTDGALYPFMELSAGQRSSIFLVEVGMRINIMRFHFDDYESQCQG